MVPRSTAVKHTLTFYSSSCSGSLCHHPPTPFYPATKHKSYPYINHSLIPLATRYTESIDFFLPPCRSTDCKETLHNGHKQEVEKQTTGVFGLTTMADSEALVTTLKKGELCFAAHSTRDGNPKTACKIQIERTKHKELISKM